MNCDLQRHESIRVCSVIASVALITGMLAVLAPGANASTAPCTVKNVSTGHVYTGTGSNLQTAINAANAGTKLQVKGICTGNFTIAKNLKLVGSPTASYPTPTLDGGGYPNSTDSVLIVSGVSSKVALVKITVTNGSRCDGLGGGIYNAGTLVLTNSTVVWNNLDFELCIDYSLGGWDGGGIYNTGTLTLNSSHVDHNWSTNGGGGIYNAYGTRQVAGDGLELSFGQPTTPRAHLSLHPTAHAPVCPGVGVTPRLGEHEPAHEVG